MKRNGILIALCALAACSSPTAETYYRQGRAAREAGEPVAAMESFIAATRVHSDEYLYKGKAYSNMATMCRIGEQHASAYALYEQSALQFIQSDDSLAYAHALNNMAWEQAVMGNKKEAITLTDSAIGLCPAEAVAEKTQETHAAACLYTGEYDSVLYYTQKNPMESAYFAILRAQAYTFLEQHDSALYYARIVMKQTDNPRYLDDVYYILTHCDSTAAADDIRKLASARTDIQRSLESHDPQWTQALLMAQEAMRTPEDSRRRVAGILAVGIALCVAGWAAYRITRRKQKHTISSDIAQQCRELRRSAQLRTELNWFDYNRFCETCNSRLNGIADKLTQRGLTEREVRICVLVMIGLSYAEIAEILYRAESGIGKDKYTIAKRLGVRVKDLQNTLRAIAGDKEHA